MNELLAEVLDAHGGLERWNRFATVAATVVGGGALWEIKGAAQDPGPRRLTVWLATQHAVVAPFGAAGRSSDFTPGRIAIVDSADRTIAARDDPRASFAGHVMATRWDPLQQAYFTGAALWTCLTTPFLLAWPGVEMIEVEPWLEGEARWRVLLARFPAAMTAHSALQSFYFGEDLLLRRHDYQVDVAGGFAAAQLVGGYVETCGLRLPTRQRAYLRGPQRRIEPDPVMLSIDLSDIRFAVRAASGAYW